MSAPRLEQVAGGVVLGPDGRMVLVNQCGTSWSLPKGHAEPGEDLRQAALREIREESGLAELDHVADLGAYERSAISADGSVDETRRKRITLYLFRSAGGELTPEDPDNPEARWVPVEDAVALLTHPVDRARLAELLPALRPHAAAALAPAIGADLRRHYGTVPAAVLERYLSVLVTPLADLVGDAALVLDKPYGTNVIVADVEDFGISVARLHPGRSSSFHYHERRRELFTVRTGVLTVDRGETRDELWPWMRGTSTPPQPHAIRNDGTADLEIAEVFSPFLLDDKIRIDDRYQRRLGRVHHLQ